MERCIWCGSRAFILFTSVECTNPSCAHFDPRALSQAHETRTQSAGRPEPRSERSRAAASFDAWAQRYRTF